ncbi:ACP S-malonyltransferase [Paenibacillus apiarius]|uniref:ACP S-malonyltransferase n=1 Tax=Paenibacillus apiarius TaxID=46240 RepID=UPI00197CF1A2|nr:ACP S-malonyltransferase [Paenibacillus apiarius]
MLAYLFPGQGSQQKGMGAEYFDEFKGLVDEADRILGYSIKRLCLEDPENQLGFTQYTQPALYVVNAMSYLKKIQDTGVKPEYVAGHSLGEYNALLAADVFDFATGLKLVKKRGELMGQASHGGMAAVVGLKEQDVREVLKKNRLDSIDIANLNTPTQIVISGMESDIEEAKRIFEEAGARHYIVVKVSGAFHSRYMESSRILFEEYLEQFELKSPVIPVISNVFARPYQKKDVNITLVNQITSSVKWSESIQYLMGKGEVEFVQVGPGNVLTGMIRSIQREAKPIYVNEDPTDDPEVQCHESKSSFMGEHLGNRSFKQDYGLKYAYLTGAMYKGIASKELVEKMGKSGMMGFFGTGGLALDEIEEAIRYLQKQLSGGVAFGMNLIYDQNDPSKEEEAVNLFLKYGVRNVKASAFISMTPAIVKYRLKGIRRDESGHVVATNRIVAKVSRPEVAEAFLSPAPSRIVEKLLNENQITSTEAELSKELPMAEDLCVEADSGGHSDRGVAYALMPAMLRLRDDMMKKYNYKKMVRVGAAGGIGTPEAAAASFIMGADFIVTGSINQCTVEARTSDLVKDMLQQINVQDTEYAPAGDMFEFGAKVQVMKKGVFFPFRANKLYELYRQYDSIHEIDEKTKIQIQERYFKRSFEQVYEDVTDSFPQSEIDKAEKNPKHKMALIFRWYFEYSTRLALSGDVDNRVDYQVHCGPALGAFNQWVKGSDLEDWRKRHVDVIGKKLMNDTAEILQKRFSKLKDGGIK